MRKTLYKVLLVTAVLGVVFLSGCRSTEVILVHETTPTLLAQDVKAHVYVDVGGKLTRSDNKVVIKHGTAVMVLTAEEIEDMFK